MCAIALSREISFGPLAGLYWDLYESCVPGSSSQNLLTGWHLDVFEGLQRLYSAQVQYHAFRSLHDKQYGIMTCYAHGHDLGQSARRLDCPQVNRRFENVTPFAFHEKPCGLNARDFDNGYRG